MKNFKTIGLTIILSLVTIFNIQAQTSTNETKRELIENLISTKSFLNFASNPQYKTETRLDAFNTAVDHYNQYKKAYEKLKATLPTDVKSQLDLVMNIYGQVCTNEGFQYLTDMNTVTAMTICSAKIEKVTETMLK